MRFFVVHQFKFRCILAHSVAIRIVWRLGLCRRPHLMARITPSPPSFKGMPLCDIWEHCAVRRQLQLHYDVHLLFCHCSRNKIITRMHTKGTIMEDRQMDGQTDKRTYRLQYP